MQLQCTLKGTCNFNVPSSLYACVGILAQLVTHHLLLVCGFTFAAGGMYKLHMDADGMLWDPCAVFLTNNKHDCSKAEIKWVLTEMGCDGIHYIQGALT